MPFIRFILFAALAALLCACVRNPLGMTDEEWQGLSSQQQMEAREKQAKLDLEQQRLEDERRARVAAAEATMREEQRKKDLAAGMIMEIIPQKPICIGGSRCGGSDTRIILPLKALASVDYILFLADDNIGDRHDAVVHFYADDQFAERVDIKKRKQWHEAFIGKMARNIVIRPEGDDELRIYHIKIFGQKHDSGNEQFIIIRK
ncbi:hypothetical protein N1030_15015 [Desulfovibrio mangrovi]|uniref:hypothetical protein n=1 Tax=Desulfovibrio mangrovi TaxID=2976983 RepID=UPI0022470A5D|nr:hypothetical protein [Desulfovibrio mangrovi]UZP66903.1 hypothetical protein N1030_15015 [Desulfovibrio mangrovi]